MPSVHVDAFLCSSLAFCSQYHPRLAQFLSEMSPMEKVVFIVAKTTLGSKEMRTALFFYVLGMHLLVFVTTYHWSHMSGCDSFHSKMHWLTFMGEYLCQRLQMVWRWQMLQLMQLLLVIEVEELQCSNIFVTRVKLNVLEDVLHSLARYVYLI